MGGTDPGSARDEAERLVATLLATAKMAGASREAAGWGPLGEIFSGVFGHIPTDREAPARPAATPGPATSGGFATGSPECCVCPVCRGVAALRDPSPEFAERLATGAGDLAAGVASLLRAFGSPPTDPPRDRPRPAADQPAGRTGAEKDQPAGASGGAEVWREATRTGHDSHPAPEPDVWSAATRAEDVAAPAAPVPPVDAAGPTPVPGHSAGRTGVPTSRTPGEVVEDAPGDGA